MVVAGGAGNGQALGDHEGSRAMEVAVMGEGELEGRGRGQSLKAHFGEGGSFGGQAGGSPRHDEGGCRGLEIPSGSQRPRLKAQAQA